ncbi:MAG: leucine--tRNA ligase [Bacteroidales bacterium]
MEYNFLEIEKKWQACWADKKIFKATEDSGKQKYYVLDMFPYPSGAGLHVGHPLGYIASDIVARYKRMQGYNVLHPMGFDAFGLPAEQYAIQTGTHPAVTTEKNIRRYRQQFDRMGFSFDWDREVRTSDPGYYKWTQWTFLKLFHHWYDTEKNKARPLQRLIEKFETAGSAQVHACHNSHEPFTAKQWHQWTEAEQQQMLMNYRLAYLSQTMVNWCPALGTVLANDEVKDGYSERGGHPVEQKKMMQWSLRISAYARRLLDNLENLQWPESIKEIQRNWIGRSRGAAVYFPVKGTNKTLEVFTTRPDTLYGSSFMVLAPEHEMVEELTRPENQHEVQAYISRAKNRSERERMAETKEVSGVFTGSYGINPLNGKEMPIWVADYVLGGYGTGAIMAVPAHDNRDFQFARKFNLPIIQVVAKHDETPVDPRQWEDSYDAKDGFMINSDMINGLEVNDAINIVIQKLEQEKLGYGTINYRLRDAIFSRQRYWGEPFPIYYKEGIPYGLDESKLPLELPEVDKYEPTEKGEPPLARAKNWKTEEGYPLETNTMPGFAGSSGYFYRYMDPHNAEEYFSNEANAYWRDVDLYLGGDEHATGHLIYARFWAMFLYDMGMTVEEEPFKRMINQGKIQGRSNFVYRIPGTQKFVSYNKRKAYKTQKIHVDINIVHNDVLDVEAFRKWMPEYKNAEFITEDDGSYICGWEVEKMSKSKYNVQTPDELIMEYGADTFRMYEMFLGPIESHKPWDTQGIEGVSRFIRKFWRLFHDEKGRFVVSPEKPNDKELKVLHQTIKKVKEDMERLSFNTSVSQFMICVNELGEMKSNKRELLEPLTLLLAPFAPHITEEIWSLLGHKHSITFAPVPEFDESCIQESTFLYPVSFNGKMRFKIELPLDMSKEDIQKAVLQDKRAAKYLGDQPPQKVIVVPQRIVNVVIGK